MDEIIIRPATVDDAPGIATVHVKTWQFSYRGYVPDDFLDNQSIDERTARWRAILARLGVQERTFVAELGGEIAGFCSTGKSRDDDADGATGEVYAIYVAPQYMRIGVGSALFQAGHEHLSQQGFEHFTLWVLESNQRARQFYEKQGWRADGTRKTEEIANVEIQEVRYASNNASHTSSQES